MDTKKLRQKILDLAIRGKLVPQDPNDEPASVLLERIREEKERLIKEGKIKRSKKTASSDTYHYENVPFEVPEGWVWCKLENITVLIEDCPHTTAKDEGKGYPLVRTPNIGEGQLLLDGVHRVSKEVYDKRNVRAVPQVDDIIYAREAPAGNVAVIRENEQVCLGQRTVLIRPMNTLIDSVWLTYAMLAPYSKNHLTSKATGSTVTHVNMASIRSFDLPLPPLSEQHRIVAEIKRWFALIDQIEQGKADLQTIIKQTKSKILGLAIHGKLVPQAPNDEPAIELLKRINPDFTPCDNGHYTQLPNGWAVCRLDQVADALDNLRKPINSNERNLRIKGKQIDRLYPYYGATGQVGLIDDYIVDGHYLLLGEDGAPFLDKNAIKAYSISGKSWVNNHAHILSPKIDFEFLQYSLNQIDYSEYVNGSTRLKLTQTDMRSIRLMLPPLSEQKLIKAKIQTLFSQLDMIMGSL